MNDRRIQAMFKRSIHHNLSMLRICQGYYELPKRTIRANGDIYHIFKSNQLRNFHNVYQDKTSMNMTFNKYNYLLAICWEQTMNLQLLLWRMLKIRDDIVQDHLLCFFQTQILFNIWYMSICPNVSEQDMINLARLAEQQKNQRSN